MDTPRWPWGPKGRNIAVCTRWPRYSRYRVMTKTTHNILGLHDIQYQGNQDSPRYWVNTGYCTKTALITQDIVVISQDDLRNTRYWVWIIRITQDVPWLSRSKGRRARYSTLKTMILQDRPRLPRHTQDIVEEYPRVPKIALIHKIQYGTYQDNPRCRRSTRYCALKFKITQDIPWWPWRGEI